MRQGLRRAMAALVASAAVATLLPAQADADPRRPQLDDATAATQRLEDYLDQGPAPWRPQVLTALAGAAADFTVAADGSGTHRSVQAAIDALPPAAAATRRHVIRIRPGVYREVVCAKGKAPFALVGDAADASAVRLVEGRWNTQPKRPGVDPANPCDPALAAATMGTAGSASVAIFSDDVQIAHLTIANDAMDGVRHHQGYPSGASDRGGAQAVALMTQGDRIQLEDVRLVGHQDTFFARAAGPGVAARVYVHRSLIAGDVDFIFGDATLVIHRSVIHSRGGRRPPGPDGQTGSGGHVLAPSHEAAQALGFLVQDSRFVAEPGLGAATVSIGRAWDRGVAHGQWRPGAPNGQALVRDSRIGGHIGPWSASTSRRPFAAQGEAANRMAEYRNRLLDHGPGREVLPVDDGWAAAAGGTRGGAEAEPERVFTVRTRAELATALAPDPAGAPRPRIVQVQGRIDLSSDDQGRPLGAEDFRDPAFDAEAFRRAFDPATWGLRRPEGPLEAARQRSARRQAAHVMLRVPSQTTIVGVTPDAALVHGGLLLEQVDDVIVRHLRLSDAYDHFPAWDPRDNGHGEWNAELDNLTLRRATHVWIDRCDLDDGERPDHGEPHWFGRPVQRHDGLLDITHRSDFVTVSWSRFRDHDKTLLIGGSDQHRDDAGHLRVTLHHNLFDGTRERTPRVRFGRVHVYNNLYRLRADGPAAGGYSIGVGLESRIVAEANAWEAAPGVPPSRLLRVFKGRALAERGSLFNGAPVDLRAALREAGTELMPDVGWTPSLVHELDSAAVAAERVRQGAGSGAGRRIGDNRP